MCRHRMMLSATSQESLQQSLGIEGESLIATAATLGVYAAVLYGLAAILVTFIRIALPSLLQIGIVIAFFELFGFSPPP